jgi:hypothetical protein
MLIAFFLPILVGVLLGKLLGSVGWAIFSIGGGLLACAILARIAEVEFRKRAHHTDGTVIAYEKKVAGEDAWYPIVRYTLPDGQEITFQSQSSHIGIRKSLPVSTKVGVLYDPTHPERAMIGKPGSIGCAPYAVGLFGIACMVLGILILVGLLPSH